MAGDEPTLEASVIVPTRNRPGYLRTALESLAVQDLPPETYETLVVDDGPSPSTREVAREVAGRTGARIGYVERHGVPGLNSARNTGVAASDAPFVVFVDDDIEAPKQWLRELLAARRRHPGYQVFGGPIRLRLEGSRLRMCGRESPPITTLDGGLRDREIELVWGANMGVDREAFELAGPFDPGVPYGFDEDMWERRLRAAGGRIMYVARAGLVHRRDRRDARLGALARAAYLRGRNLRAYSEHTGRAPSLVQELRVLAGCVFHIFRYRCGNGILLTAHSAGRVRECLAEELRSNAESDAPSLA
jgi:GT2 family glycosyltransferase